MSGHIYSVTTQQNVTEIKDLIDLVKNMTAFPMNFCPKSRQLAYISAIKVAKNSAFALFLAGILDNLDKISG